MSKRAVEKAIAYADKKLQVVDPELWETSYTRYRKMSFQVMSGGDVEEAYQDGYEQAEKDTIERALSWLKYAQEKHMTLDGTIAYFKAVMEEE